MRLYRHFAFRDWLSSQPKTNVKPQVSHLDEKDQWWKGYFGNSFASRQREYFAGQATMEGLALGEKAVGSGGL
jgi:hypothetical protein